MTRYQMHCLKFISKFQAENNGVSPSVAEIAAGIGITSKGSVIRYLDILENGGLIRRTKHRARSIQIIDPGEVKLNAEIFRLVQDYAKQENIAVDTAANELLRQSLGAAA